MTFPSPALADAAVAEVVTLASDLIAIDTTNTGDKSAAGTEGKAAEYVAGKLSDAGYDVTYVESGAPGRGNVIARLAGADSARGALLVHGHLDVVPADASEWSVHPFSGEVKDGYVDLALIGDEATVAAGIRRYLDAGATDVRISPAAFATDEERVRTWQLVGQLARDAGGRGGVL
ncbi:MAG: hypothetical protein ABSA02_05030 [Trebonia sp.]